MCAARPNGDATNSSPPRTPNMHGGRGGTNLTSNSPLYSPNSPLNSPHSPQISRLSPRSPHSLCSPQISPHSPRSPQISPLSPRSPQTSPCSPRNLPRSPQISPNSPLNSPNSPRISSRLPRSPRNLPRSPWISPNSPLNSPRSLPTSPRSPRLPAPLTGLCRSPNAEKPDRVWTVGESGSGHPGPNDIIITDICLNHKPELSFNTGAILPRPPSHPYGPNNPPVNRLSASNLQWQAQQLSLQGQPFARSTTEGRCSLWGSARAILARFTSLLRGGGNEGESIGGTGQSERGTGQSERVGQSERGTGQSVRGIQSERGTGQSEWGTGQSEERRRRSLEQEASRTIGDVGGRREGYEGRGEWIEGRGEGYEGRGEWIEGRGEGYEGRGERIEGRGSEVWLSEQRNISESRNINERTVSDWSDVRLSKQRNISETNERIERKQQNISDRIDKSRKQGPISDRIVDKSRKQQNISELNERIERKQGPISDKIDKNRKQQNISEINERIDRKQGPISDRIVDKSRKQQNISEINERIDRKQGPISDKIDKSRKQQNISEINERIDRKQQNINEKIDRSRKQGPISEIIARKTDNPPQNTPQNNPPAPGRVVTPELFVSNEKDGLKRRESWKVLGDIANLQGRPSVSSDDPVYQNLTHLETPQEGRLREVRSLLDVQRKKERSELHPARYLDDLRVLYNIYRRELVSQLLYREGGQIFPRAGTAGEPPPVNQSKHRVISSPTRDHIIQPQPQPLHHQQTLITKIASLRPMVRCRDVEPEPCWGESEFIQACLRAHNLYRARHSAPPLTLSHKLCSEAQAWVNQLAHTGTLMHRGKEGLGENMFCRNTPVILRGKTSIVPDITGEEVAAYWYSGVRQYRFNKASELLQASQGPFTQMVWSHSKHFGIGKARSRSGKIIVVAHYSPPGNIEHMFKENVHPLNTRALAKEILGHVPGVGVGGRGAVDGHTVERVLGVLAAQPPRLTGRNATKVIAAHLLGHTASLITTPDEQIEVVINKQVTPSKHKVRDSTPASTSAQAPAQDSNPRPQTPLQEPSLIPEVSCCPARFRMRARASVSPAEAQSINERSDNVSEASNYGVLPPRNWLQGGSNETVNPNETVSNPNEVIELKHGGLVTPRSAAENIASLPISALQKTALRPKRARLRNRNTPSETSDVIRSISRSISRSASLASLDSVDSQSHPEPRLSMGTDSGMRGTSAGSCEVLDPKKLERRFKLPFESPTPEHGRMNYYALSPVPY